jgi:hypothetical protein
MSQVLTPSLLHLNLESGLVRLPGGAQVPFLNVSLKGPCVNITELRCEGLELIR